MAQNPNPSKAICQLCKLAGHEALTCTNSPVAVPMENKTPTNKPAVNSSLKAKEPNFPKIGNINTVNVPKYLTVVMLINNIPCHMMIDSGASRTLVSERWVRRFLRCLPEPISTHGLQLVAANRTLIDIPFKLPQVELSINRSSVKSDLLIMPNIPDDCKGMLGLEMLTSLDVQLDFGLHNLTTARGTKEIQLHDYYPCEVAINPANNRPVEEEIIVERKVGTGEQKIAQTSSQIGNPPTENSQSKEEQPACFRLAEKVTIPGYSQSILPIKLPELFNEDVILEGFPVDGAPCLWMGKSLVRGDQDIVYVPCLNSGIEEVTLNEDKVAGCIGVIDYSSGPDVLKNPSAETTIKFDLDHLDEDKKERMEKLLFNNLEVFSRDRTDLGRTHLCEHEIEVLDKEPIRQYPRRKSPEARRLEEELIQQMIESDVIRPSISPWASPILLTKKADGSTRFCIDFRKVNNITKKDSYPICNITESLESLKGSQWFSIMDLQSGFWQVPIKEEHKEITAFTTGRKLYEFQVLPFGMTNSPATFARLMEKVLENLQWEICLIYIDDILVFARDFQELLDRTQIIFDRLVAAGLKLKPSKCQFGIQKVCYLGFIVSDKGISVDQSKVDPILNMPPPKTLKEVRSFLGMAGYYRRFIKDFSKIAGPITKLTHKDMEIIWSEECSQAFETLKDKLTSAPILAYRTTIRNLL